MWHYIRYRLFLMVSCKPAAGLNKIWWRFLLLVSLVEVEQQLTKFYEYFLSPIISPAGVKVFLFQISHSVLEVSIYIACASSSGVLRTFLSHSLTVPPCEVKRGAYQVSLLFLVGDSASCSPRTSKYPMVYLS